MVFDKTRVCVRWSESLVGTYGIFADDLKQLESLVLGHYPAINVGRVLPSGDNYYIFKLASRNDNFKYYYPFEFSPYWDMYLKGADVYIKQGYDKRRIPDGVYLTDQSYWSDDLEYSLEGSLYNDNSAMFAHFCLANTVAELTRMVSSGLVLGVQDL